MDRSPAPSLLDAPLLRACDHPTGVLSHRHDRGELLRLTRGHYTPAPATGAAWQEHRLVDLARLRAVSESLQPGHVVGGWHAALLHQLPVLEVPDKVTVFGEVKHNSTRPLLGHRHVYRPLMEEEVTVIDGVLTTSVQRTVLDVIRLDTTAHAIAVMDHVLRQESRLRRRADERGALMRAEGVRQKYLDLLANERRRGNAQARAAVLFADPRAESLLESLGRRAVHILGLPAPTPQLRVQCPHRTAYTDLGWEFDEPGHPPAAHFEFDGAMKYDGAGTDDATYQGERNRDRDLRALGHVVEHFTYVDARDPGMTAFRRAVPRCFPPRVWQRAVPRRELMTPQERALL